MIHAKEEEGETLLTTTRAAQDGGQNQSVQ